MKWNSEKASWGRALLNGHEIPAKCDKKKLIKF